MSAVAIRVRREFDKSWLYFTNIASCDFLCFGVIKNREHQVRTSFLIKFAIVIIKSIANSKGTPAVCTNILVKALIRVALPTLWLLGSC